jgi:hypothetical protein
MISHILALGSIQSVRCLLGLAFGCFLVFRSWNIPLERRSRLEEGDGTFFLCLGIASLALAVLRGVQGIETVRAVRRARRAWTRRRQDRGGRKIIAAGITLWALAAIAVGLVWLYSFWYAPRARETLPFWLQWGISARLALLLGWLTGTAILLALRLFRIEGRRLRRLGIFMAVIDLVDLTGFPFTTAAGTYGLLVCRHADTIDFFEGTFSAPAASTPAAKAA